MSVLWEVISIVKEISPQEKRTFYYDGIYFIDTETGECLDYLPDNSIIIAYETS